MTSSPPSTFIPWVGPFQTLARDVQTLQTQVAALQGRMHEISSAQPEQRIAPTNDPIPGSGEYQHRATPREWETLRRHGPTGNTNDSITLEIADRLAAVEQALQSRAVKESLIAAPTPAPSIEPPELSDGDRKRLELGVAETIHQWMGRIHRAGWDAAMAAVAAQQQPASDRDTLVVALRVARAALSSGERTAAALLVIDSALQDEPPADHFADASKMVEAAPAPTPEPVPAEQLPELWKAVSRAFGVNPSKASKEWKQNCCDVILAVADWLDQYALHKLSAIALRQEVTR